MLIKVSQMHREIHLPHPCFESCELARIMHRAPQSVAETDRDPSLKELHPPTSSRTTNTIEHLHSDWYYSGGELFEFVNHIHLTDLEA
jgi:hypothetical protein